MLKRLSVVGLVVLLVLLAALPSQAGGQWMIYLYNNSTGALLRVGADGTVDALNLGLPADQYPSAYNSKIDVATNRAAACLSVYQDAGLPNTTLYLQDLSTGQTLWQQDLGGVMGCAVQAFSADGSLVAVGLANYYPGSPDADPSKPTWQLLLLDPADGTIKFTLDPTSPEAAGQLAPEETILPEVRYFQDGNAVIAAVPFGIGGASAFNAFNWRYAEATLTPAPEWGKLGVDSFGGELIWVDNNPNLPAIQPFGPFPPLNAVYVADKSGSQNMIYHNARTLR